MFKNLNRLDNKLPPVGFDWGSSGTSGQPYLQPQPYPQSYREPEHFHNIKYGSSGKAGTYGMGSFDYTNNGYVGPSVENKEIKVSWGNLL